jgi:thiol-disulfide isomerase/thioredoxin
MHQRETTYARWLAIVGGVFLIVAAVLEYWPSKNELRWLGIDEAKATAIRLKRPMLVDFYAEWCGPCKSMEKSVFPDDSVQLILKSRYVLAKINGDDPVLGDTLRKQFHIRAYPTYIVLTPTGRERKRHVGFYPRSPFIEWLNDSTGVEIFQWKEFDNAVTEASLQKRRVMVLVLNSSEEIESVNGMFEEQKVGEIIGKHFVPTLLVKGNSSDRAAIEQLGLTEKGGMGEVIVLESDRKEVGRFRIESQMEFNNAALANKLTELVAK